MKKKIIILTILVQYGCANDNYYYKNNQKVTLRLYNSTSRSSSDIDYYQNENEIVLGVTNKLIVKLKDDKYLTQILNEFHLTLEKNLSYNMYLLKTTDKNLTIDISNRLNEKEYVKYAHPDFIKKRINR